MHFSCASIPNHLHEPNRRSPADDRVVNKHDALACKHSTIGGKLHPHPHIPGSLGRQNKGPAHLMITDNAHLEGHPSLLSIA